MEPLLSKNNKEASSLLSHLFHDKIIQIESNTKEKISFSKQLEIKKLKDEVELFIEKNPFSIIEVRTLKKEAEDNEDFKVALSFKNYKERPENAKQKPSRLLIVIDSAFNTAQYFEWALNNVLLPL